MITPPFDKPAIISKVSSTAKNAGHTATKLGLAGPGAVHKTENGALQAVRKGAVSSVYPGRHLRASSGISETQEISILRNER